MFSAVQIETLKWLPMPCQLKCHAVLVRLLVFGALIIMPLLYNRSNATTSMNVQSAINMRREFIRLSMETPVPEATAVTYS